LIPTIIAPSYNTSIIPGYLPSATLITIPGSNAVINEEVAYYSVSNMTPAG